MLKIGLTGGIASGKSLVAARLKERGAVLVDADSLAREVVEPGTEGLERIVAEFGEGMLDDGGRLDRARLGAEVFGNQERLAVLNGIVHPLVRARAKAIVDAAAAGAVVVQDIPLLVETGQGSDFHLVLVVDAPEDIRLQRMLEHRGMTAEAARSRIAAQASREDRLAAADVVLDNSGSVESLLDRVDALWDGRLVPFAHNLAEGRRAQRVGGPVLVTSRPQWQQEAPRIMGRIRSALAREDGVAPESLRLEHIGSTSVPGLDAMDVIDLQLGVPDLTVADRLAAALARAGYPVVPGISSDTTKRLHANADPGRHVNLHVRAEGSPEWRFALGFRDWLRADSTAASDYLALKQRLAAQHAGDTTAEAYAEAKEDWFTAAGERLEAWITRTGWTPPSYGP